MRVRPAIFISSFMGVLFARAARRAIQLFAAAVELPSRYALFGSGGLFQRRRAVMLHVPQRRGESGGTTGAGEIAVLRDSAGGELETVIEPARMNFAEHKFRGRQNGEIGRESGRE